MSYNDHLVLLSGKSATGKSSSLMTLRNPEGVMYLNCEHGKKLPFRSQFQQYTITDPLDILSAVAVGNERADIHTIVIDSLTFLLDAYESKYIYGSANGQKAWGDFQQFFKTLMQEHVATSTKKIIFLAHTVDSYNESELAIETKVPVKGSLKNNGIESYFTVVMSTKKMTLKSLKDYNSALLNITPQEEALGFKYVIQTQITKETTGERERGPMGLFSTDETYIDNSMQAVLDRLVEYYG